MTMITPTDTVPQVVIDHPAGFSLSGTLVSGQCFRWRLMPDGSLCGAAGDRAVTMHLRGGDLQLLWSEEDNHVYQQGPAAFVFDGIWPDA